MYESSKNCVVMAKWCAGSVGFIVLFWTGPTAAQVSTSDVLSKAIAKLAPRGGLVRAADIDQASCGPVSENAGLLQADFNGDGRQDYASLLKPGETGKETKWQGVLLRESAFSFVFFIDDGNGGLKTVTAHRYSNFIPSTVIIDLQQSGDILNRQAGRNVSLPNPGERFSFCEKSAQVYFFLGDRLRSFPISD